MRDGGRNYMAISSVFPSAKASPLHAIIVSALQASVVDIRTTKEVEVFQSSRDFSSVMIGPV